MWPNLSLKAMAPPFDLYFFMTVSEFLGPNLRCCCKNPDSILDLFTITSVVHFAGLAFKSILWMV